MSDKQDDERRKPQGPAIGNYPNMNQNYSTSSFRDEKPEDLAKDTPRQQWWLAVLPIVVIGGGIIVWVFLR